MGSVQERLADMPTRTGAQIIWECLVHEGVNTVFGYPGGAILPAYDAMLDYPVRHVLVRHVQDIMPAMKEAFHLAKSGRPGPVLVDITKDAQQASMDWEWDPSPVKMRG